MSARAGRALMQQNSYVILRIPKKPERAQKCRTMKTIILQTLAPFSKVLTNSVARKPWAARRGFLLIPLILASFALCQQVQSAPDRPKQSAPDTPEVLSAPDNPDPGGTLPLSNTADGASALLSITTGLYNSAFGFDASY